MNSPGQLFNGTIPADARAFLKRLVTNARAKGYEHFHAPVASALQGALIAIESGYPAANIHATDTTLFSAVLGYSCAGIPMAELGITADGFYPDDLVTPEMVLYAHEYIALGMRSGYDYFRQLLYDLRYRKEEHVAFLRGQVEALTTKLHGIDYRSEDTWLHLADALRDPKAIIFFAPPPGKNSDENKHMTWYAPVHEPLDFGKDSKDNGMDRVREMALEGKALFICMETREERSGYGLDIYGRKAGSKGLVTYLWANRPDEAAALTGGKQITTENAQKLEPISCPIIPADYMPGEDATVEIVTLKPENANYYRKLWTHNFVGSGSNSGLGLVIDGFIAGVFGYDKGFMVEASGAGDMFLLFAVCGPSRLRLNKLLNMAALAKCVAYPTMTDLDKERFYGLKTAIITKHQECMELRGIMKKIGKEPAKPLGFKLTYRGDFHNKSVKEVYTEWHKKEMEWQAGRSATKS